MAENKWEPVVLAQRVGQVSCVIKRRVVRIKIRNVLKDIMRQEKPVKQARRRLWNVKLMPVKDMIIQSVLQDTNQRAPVNPEKRQRTNVKLVPKDMSVITESAINS